MAVDEAAKHAGAMLDEAAQALTDARKLRELAERSGVPEARYRCEQCDETEDGDDVLFVRWRRRSAGDRIRWLGWYVHAWACGACRAELRRDAAGYEEGPSVSEVTGT